MTSSLTWLFPLLGWTLAAAGITLLLWSLFRDRSRGRRRCPKCWYDLSGVPGLLCPECGRAARSERKLAKTRRKWLRAVAGLLIISAGVLATRTPQIARRGWMSIVPSSVLIFWPHATDYPPQYPVFTGTGMVPPSTPTPAQQELHTRYTTRTLWHWQQAIVSHKIEPTPPDLRGALWVPRRIPDGAHVRLLLPSSIGAGGLLARKLVVTGSFRGGQRSEGTPQFVRTLTTTMFDVGTPTPGPVHICAEIYEQGRGDENTCSVLLWRQDVTLRTRVGGSIEEILTPATSEAVQRALSAIRIGWIENQPGYLYVALPPDESLVGIALGLSIDIERDGAPISHTEAPLRIPSSTGGGQWWLPLSKPLDPQKPGALRARVKGDGTVALLDAGATSFWRGEVSVPVDTADKR